MPRVGEGQPKRSGHRDDGPDEDGPATTEVVITWNSQPAPNSRTHQVRTGIDEPDQGDIILEAKVLQEEKLRAADRGFVHALDGGRQSADDTHPPYRVWLVESLLDLPEKNLYMVSIDCISRDRATSFLMTSTHARTSLSSAVASEA